MMASRRLTWLVALLALASCGTPHTTLPEAIFAPPNAPRVAATTAVTPLAQPQPCLAAFVPHLLDASTVVNGDTVHLFDSNGSGVAINDLDGDGRPDLVFPNLDGPDTIFWNEGGLAFSKQPLDDSNSRGINSVDVDGDGRLDLVFTHRAGSVSYWHNGGGRTFKQQALKGVLAPAYSMDWGDLNGDNALDLVTGSYDAELMLKQTNGFLFSDGAGVYAYQQRPDGSFASERLARKAQALAIALPDLNADGRPDIMVGNDFNTPDQMWLHTDNVWTVAPSFAATSESTMSIDQGDVDNDGRPELFATDMKPYGIDTYTLASWLPMMATMPQKRDPADPQIVENVLQMRGADGRFHNEARARGVDASGWSWSGKFGDLDNDGALDLYVVNGMIARELFHHLPHDELVEQNQALRNDGTGHFTPAPQWGLGSSSSGRGMTMADLDGDGDLDVVINNLRAPAQVFENRLCGGSSVEVDLRWPSSKNTFALGARLVLHTSAGNIYRDVHAGGGYLSGDPARIHIGVPSGATLQRLDILWPDGALSSIDGVNLHTLLTVTRPA